MQFSSIDRALSDATIPGQSEPGSKCHIQDTHEGGGERESSHLQRRSWCIIQPQPTGQSFNVKTVLFQAGQFSMSTQFNCQKYFYFKLFCSVNQF